MQNEKWDNMRATVSKGDNMSQTPKEMEDCFIRFYKALKQYEKENPKVSYFGDDNSKILQTGGK